MLLRTALALVLAGLAAGCGSTSVPSVEDAVRSYSGAFLAGQGEKAAAMLSTRCDAPALRQQIVLASKAVPALYGQARIDSIRC